MADGPAWPEIVDVKHSWATIAQIVQELQNRGVDKSVELKATPGEFLMAANCLVLNIVWQGVPTADRDDRHVVAEYLRLQQKIFTNEYRNGLIELEAQITQEAN